MTGTDVMTLIQVLEDQGTVSVCMVCEQKVAVLQCEHGDPVAFDLDGTLHRPCAGHDGSTLKVVTFPYAYAGLSGAELLAEARQLEQLS